MAPFTIEKERKGSNTLVIKCFFQASPEKVFKAWTDPIWLAQWMCPASGSGATVEKFDLSIGGKYQLTMHFESGEETVAGEFLEIMAPYRLALTWQWLSNDTTPKPTEITIDLMESGNGCEMLMSHSRFISPEVRDKHIEGWESCIGQLNRFNNKEQE